MSFGLRSSACLKDLLWQTTPSAQDKIHPGDTLVVLGTRGQVTRLEALMRGEEPVDKDS